MTYHARTRTLALMALFSAQGIVLHIIESYIPIPFIIPGAKLGLANIVTVSALYVLSPVKVLGVIIVRVLLSSIFAGTMITFAYSMAGAVLSYAMMLLLKSILRDKVGLIGISCTGAVFHNIGQLLVASIMIGSIRIISYLPFLSLAGIITGIFVGIASHYLVMSTKRFQAKVNI